MGAFKGRLPGTLENYWWGASEVCPRVGVRESIRERVE